MSQFQVPASPGPSSADLPPDMLSTDESFPCSPELPQSTPSHFTHQPETHTVRFLPWTRDWASASPCSEAQDIAASRQLLRTQQPFGLSQAQPTARSIDTRACNLVPGSGQTISNVYTRHGFHPMCPNPAVVPLMPTNDSHQCPIQPAGERVPHLRNTLLLPAQVLYSPYQHPTVGIIFVPTVLSIPSEVQETGHSPVNDPSHHDLVSLQSPSLGYEESSSAILFPVDSPNSASPFDLLAVNSETSIFHRSQDIEPGERYSGSVGPSSRANDLASESNARLVFQRADSGNTGYMAFTQFQNALRWLNVPIGYRRNLALDEFVKLDEDKDYLIRETEFVNGYMRDRFSSSTHRIHDMSTACR